MTIFEVSFFGLDIAPTWYGFMYALGFIICYTYIEKYGYIARKDMDIFLYYIFFGVIVGGRLGYVLLYNFSYFFNHPIEVFAIWQGGMSFHGGALGVIIALILFAKKYNYRIFDISDVLVSILPIALGLGRIGNLINKELLGYSGYTGPFAIIKDGISYFPAPLLQACFEGIILFILLQCWRFYECKNGRLPGIASSVFLIGYAFLRILAELVRSPDTHIGYLAGTTWLTLGMIYSIPMIIVGVYIYYLAHSNPRRSRLAHDQEEKIR